MFTPTPRSFVVSHSRKRELLGYLCQERVSEGEEQSNTHTDHGYGVEQTGNDEHFNLQNWDDFRLKRGAFQEIATQKNKDNDGTQGTKANQQCKGESG